MRPQSRRAKPAPEAPRAVACPSIVSGGGGGRSSTIIGIGFQALGSALKPL